MQKVHWTQYYEIETVTSKSIPLGKPLALELDPSSWRARDLSKKNKNAVLYRALRREPLIGVHHVSKLVPRRSKLVIMGKGLLPIQRSTYARPMRIQGTLDVEQYPYTSWPLRNGPSREDINTRYLV
jgi:hypothetical protein